MHSDGGAYVVRLEGGIARFVLARVGKANRIQPDDLELFERELAACEADSSVSSILLAPAGHVFSAGFDLRALQDHGNGGDDGKFSRFANALASTPLLTVVAINGAAIGGATDLALACDIRIGCPRARFMMPAARFGLPLYAGALQRYVANFGLSQAKRLILLAQTIDASGLQAAGVLSEIVADDMLAERALEIARSLAALPPKPASVMKHALGRIAQGSADLKELQRELDAVFDAAAIAQRIAAARSGRNAADTEDHKATRKDARS